MAMFSFGQSAALSAWMVSAAVLGHAQQNPPAARVKPEPMLVTPTDRVIVQRGFVPCDGRLRLYACVVGTPVGLHYAYDFEMGAVLSVWRGPFVDMGEIWGPRARSHAARPAGAEVALARKPLLALFSNRAMIEYPKTWPREAPPLYTAQGYELEPDGQPVFLARCEDLIIRDRIAPTAGGRELQRRLEFSGKLSSWETWLLLAEAENIALESDGRTWTAGGPSWTLAWSKEQPGRPTLRQEAGRTLLVFRLTTDSLAAPVAYSIRW
jgi:hypothetical protein